MGGAQGAFDAVLTPHILLALDQVEEKLLVAQRFGAGLGGHLLHIAAHGRQSQLFEALLQALFAAASGRHGVTACAAARYEGMR